MKNIRKVLALMLALCIVLGLAACGGQGSNESKTPENNPPEQQSQEQPEQGNEPSGNDLTANLTLATYPVGDMTKEEVVNALIADFNAVYPNVTVNVVYLDYTNGDQTLIGMVEGGNAPDLLLEGPERLVAKWGAEGYLVDLKDLIPAGT